MYLYLDSETRGELDLSEVGAYKYLSHHSTELLMIAYAFGDDEVKLWEKHKSPIPQELKDALEDDLQLLVMWNGANFERNLFRKEFGYNIPVDRIIDPMISARYLSMPGSQDKVGKILEIEHKKLLEKAKGDESVISFFCTPLKLGGSETLFGIEPTSYRDHTTHPRQWEMLCNRCKVDVEGMREITKRLSKFPLPEIEYEIFALNEKINDTGIYVDPVLLQGAQFVVDKEFENLYKEFEQLTGIKKPKSNPQVLAFVRNHGYTFPSIGKAFVNRALAGECNLDEVGRKALKLRLQLSKSSVSKLEAIRDSVEEDGRVRGLFNYMGAARTGRWSSGLVQLQNLIKATKEVEKKYDLALKLLRAGDYEAIKKEFTSPIDVACSALRPIFRAPKGRKFVIADLAAIECRGAGWVANCPGLMNIFAEKRDPYLMFACLMDPSLSYEEADRRYNVLKDKKFRNDAKPPMLGCGYGLTPGEIKKDDDGNVVKTGLLGYAANMGIDLPIEYAEKAVEVFRNAYREVPSFWYALHEAFVHVVENDGSVQIGPLTIEKKGRIVCLWLPSGRALHYINPEVVWTERVSTRTGRKYKSSEILVDGIDQETHQWGRIKTYGSKIFENVVQAICRDILACGMLEADKKGFEIVLTCHDEVAAEVDEDSPLGVQELRECMIKPLKWAPGFLLEAEGFVTDYYRKD